MHNPPHPGEIIRDLCLDPLYLSVSDAAKALRVSRKSLSEILYGRAGLSPLMAIRLAIAFDTTAESWMAQQAQYDLWKANKKCRALEKEVKSLAAREGGTPLLSLSLSPSLCHPRLGAAACAALGRAAEEGLGVGSGKVVAICATSFSDHRIIARAPGASLAP